MFVTDEQKATIAAALKALQVDLGSWQKAAVTAGANASTISSSMQYKENWGKVSESMWRKVANNIGVSLAAEYWQLADTTNTDLMQRYLDRAQFQSMFMAISHNAGQGKSTGVEMYRQCHDAVYFLEAEESWGHRQFVVKLAEVLGIRDTRYMRVADLTDAVVLALKRYAAKKPLVIIDEANKLSSRSLRLFIPFFNKLQDQVGMVLIGAHDLKHIIQAGVRRDERGFDELESRLGRTYWSLAGIFKRDVVAICEANGVTDGLVQNRIWQRMNPEKQMIDGRYQEVSTLDLRVLKAAVKHERASADKKAWGLKSPVTAMETVMGAQVVAV